MAQPNSRYTQALSAAIAEYSPQIGDNIMRNLPLLYFLKKRGNSRPFHGGVEIAEQVLFSEVAAKGWYSGSEVLSTAEQDVLTTANFAFKQFYTNVTMSGAEQITNAGKQRMHNLIETKLDAAEASMMNAIGVALFNSNTENGGKAIGGLQHLVSDSPSTPTVGGIDASASANAFWRNYQFGFAANSLVAGSSTILTAINTATLNTNRQTEGVDLILGGNTYFTYFEGAVQPSQRFMDPELGSVGFNAYKYKGSVVMNDPNCSATRMYGLNTKYIFFRPYEARNFTKGDQKDSLNQDLFVIPMYWAGNMTANSRQRHWVITA